MSYEVKPLLSGKLQEKTVFVFLFFLSALFLIPRFGGISYYPGRFLWAEDANIFITQAQNLGISSLWQPYAGYLHTLPRIYAWIANYCELIYRPIVLQIGWVCAYFLMIYVIIQKGRSLGLSLLSLSFLVILIPVQPNYGEVFFNITNSHWLIGVTLFLLVIVQKEVLHYKWYPLLVIMGLTGPFSIILMLIIFIKALLFKDVKRNFWLYFILIICGFIQLLVLMNSERLSNSSALAPWSEWLIAFASFFSLGAKTWLSLGVVVIFWFYIILQIFNKKNYVIENREKIIYAFFILFSVVVLIIVSLYSSKYNPKSISSFWGGNRYSWIPFSLMFFSVFLIANYKRISTIVVFSLAFVMCIDSYSFIKLPNLQFASFANFAQYKNVVIPIHPQIESFPAWSIRELKGDLQNIDAISQRMITWKSVPNPIQVDTSTWNRVFEHKKLSPIFWVSQEKLICDNAKDIGIEIVMDRASSGWMYILWSANRDFSANQVIKRWYPTGEVTLQFAFPNNVAGLTLGLGGLEYIDTNDKILKTTAYCLP